MNNPKYVAYVSTYTMGDNRGISIYDVDVEKGTFTEKGKVEITNSSYITGSHNNKYLYSAFFCSPFKNTWYLYSFNNSYS